MHYGNNQESLSAFDAITEAQKIAFAPVVFQAALCLRDYGILAFLDSKNKDGATLDEVIAHVSLNDYAVELLLDVGLSGQLITKKEQRFHLGKIGNFILNDPMTRINMDFIQDVCYQGLFRLKESLGENKPLGLKIFGDWQTIYPALSQLPEKARKSWFAFDHFYSHRAFGDALPHVFSYSPKLIYDVGGNTGKWALRCCDHDPDVNVTILDLPEQIELARENIACHDMETRISGYPVDMLSDTLLPSDADIWWMSQFLDCFSKEQIIFVLSKIKHALKPGARVCILEPLTDRQPFEAGTFSLNAGSLYFTCMASGNSRFYKSDALLGCIEKAGLKPESQIDGLGIAHSLIICGSRT